MLVIKLEVQNHTPSTPTVSLLASVPQPHRQIKAPQFSFLRFNTHQGKGSCCLCRMRLAVEERSLPYWQPGTTNTGEKPHLNFVYKQHLEQFPYHQMHHRCAGRSLQLLQRKKKKDFSKQQKQLQNNTILNTHRSKDLWPCTLMLMSMCLLCLSDADGAVGYFYCF